MAKKKFEVQIDTQGFEADINKPIETPAVDKQPPKKETSKLGGFVAYIASKKKKAEIFRQYEKLGLWFNPVLNTAGGGFPLFKLITFTGFEGLGKTTKVLQQLSALASKPYREYLNADLEVLFLDGEQRLNFKRLEDVALDPNIKVEVQKRVENGIELIEGVSFKYGDEPFGGVLRPLTYKELEEYIDQFIEYCQENKKFGVVVIDSLTSFLTEKEIKGDTEHFGAEARVLTPLLKKWNKYSSTFGITIMGIAHKREVLNQGMGNPNTLMGISSNVNEDIKGGRGLKYYSHQVLDIVKTTSKWEVFPPSADKEFLFTYYLTKVQFKKNSIYRPNNNETIYNLYIPEIGFNGYLSMLVNLMGLELRGVPKLSTRMTVSALDVIGYKKTIDPISFAQDLMGDRELMKKFLALFNVAMAKAYQLSKHYEDLRGTPAVLELELNLLELNIRKFLDFVEKQKGTKELKI